MSTEQHPSSFAGIVHRFAALQPMPWRNGGGVTRQIAAGHLNADETLKSTDDEQWDWRLSIADVDSEGDFSAFENMSRILTIIQGAGMSITIDGTEQWLEKYHPLAFDGGSKTSAMLPQGPIRDLNLITRTEKINAELNIVELAAGGSQELTTQQCAVLLEGAARLELAEGNGTELGALDTVCGIAEAARITGHGVLALFTLRNAPTR